MMRCSAGLCRRGSSVIWMLVLRGFGGGRVARPKKGVKMVDGTVRNRTQISSKLGIYVYHCTLRI